MIEIATQTIRACQQGNTAAFAEIVQVFERPLFAFVYRLHCTPPGRDVEDVVQEIFVKAYQNIHMYQIKDNGSFATWLFALGRNLCISLMRRKKLENEAFCHQNPKYVQHDRTDQPNPANILADQENIVQIARAVSNLPETQRTAFILRHYHDMAYKEIAGILECNEGTVRSRLSRARQSIALTLSVTPNQTSRRTRYDSK